MLRLNDIVEKVLTYHPQADVDIIRKAYVFSAKVHGGQVRLSGEPYLSHPLEVAGILADLRMDEVTVVVGLLHDTIEDTFATYDEIKNFFGEEVASLIDGVTKISKMDFSTSEEREAENFRKMVLAMAKDIRVILIKLTDRLHNMRTLEHLPVLKQKRIARETLDIYAPLAHRLGIAWIRWELEDFSLRYLEPEIYKDLRKKVAKQRKEREKYIDEVKKIVSEKLEEADMDGEVEGRPKHFYSIYNKMNKQGINFDQVYDLIALRIITKSVKDCYAILGLIHSLWTPVPGRFKDYIAMPKANMYQSLHTTVIGPRGERVEFQIRTWEMHRVAEEGIATHWRYKEDIKKVDKYDEKFIWLRHLLEWQQDLKDPKEFLETLKIDLFPDEVYVFTPKGDVRGFPRGATPVDFAYSIHSDVGHHCTGAKVNGKIVPLKYQMRNGDILEIHTSPTRTPSRDWLKFVKTSKARTKIKHFIKIEQNERSVALGREILEKMMKKYKLSVSKYFKSKELIQTAKDLGFLSIDSLMAGVGYGKISGHQVISKLVPEEKILDGHKKDESRLEKIVKKITGKQKEDGIRIKGIDDILIRFAKCCNPLPGDSIIGFITRGRGVTIHTDNCPNVEGLGADEARRIEVEWDWKKKIMHSTRITVYCVDKPGLLADISASIASVEANISHADVKTTEDKKAINNFVVEIKDLDHLKKVIRAVEKVKGVSRVERVTDAGKNVQEETGVV